MRFMDAQNLTMATLGGHGFGAKVALATATANLNRCTGIIALDGGPLDHTHYEAYQELSSYVQYCASLPVDKLDLAQATKRINDNVTDKKWAGILRQNLEGKSEGCSWRFNIQALAADMAKIRPDTAAWSPSYGLWPGQALCLFAAHSKWVHLATNTLQFYNVIPRLEGKFPGHINTWASEWESPANHWLHEGPDDQHVWHLSQQISRWLKNYDGSHVLLADKTEAGWYNLPDRGYDPNIASRPGESNPEFVHHNYVHSDAYEKSRAARGVEGANAGQFLPKNSFSPKW